MRTLIFRIATGVLTFLIGVGLVTGWAFHSRPAIINPVPLVEADTTKDRTLELVFVLDTTASMSHLIDGAKQRIWGIVNEVMQSPAHPAVRVGLVGFRDRGDEYLTTILPLTNDLDKVYTTLMDYRAAGGGDTPEDVRRALLEGVRNAGWSQATTNVAQIVFLVGDAPAHRDYVDEPDTAATAAEAVNRGIIINTIQCGNIAGTQLEWQAIAARGRGQYFAIPQDGGVQAIATPYDEQLGHLATKLGGTYVAYGGGAGEIGESYRLIAKETVARTEASVATSAPGEAKAQRALNKALNSAAYVGDLLQSIENGTVKLESIKEEDLPADLAKLSVEERKVEIERRLAARRDLRAQIVALSKKRDEFISAERAKQSGGKQSGFDSAVSSALKEQLTRKGF